MHLALWDRDLALHLCERSAVCQLLGKSRDQLIGQSVWDLYPESWVPMFPQMSASNGRCAFPSSSRRSPRPQEMVWNDSIPRARALADCWRDITDRKRAEEKLARSEAYLAARRREITRNGAVWPECCFRRTLSGRASTFTSLALILESF